MDKKSIKKQVKATLNNYNQIKLVFIFGSFTDKGFNENSDIDIAIASRKKIKYKLLLEIQNKLTKKIEREVDLLDFKKLNGLILKQILTKGELLINKDSSLYADIIKKMIDFQEDIFCNIKNIYKNRIERFING